MLIGKPTFTLRKRIIKGKIYEDWCAYCGRDGGKPIRFYAKSRLLVEEKVSSFLDKRRALKRRVLNEVPRSYKHIIYDAISAHEYLREMGFKKSLTELAYEYVHTKLEIHNLDKNQRITLKEAIEKFFKKKTFVSGRNLRTYISIFNKLIRHLGGSFYVHEITQEKIIVFLSKYENVTTYNSIFTRLKTLFRWLKDEGYLDKDIFIGIEKKRSMFKEPEFFDVNTVREIMMILKDNPPPYGGGLFFVLGFFCGIRTSEILRIKWEDIKLDERFVKIRQPKGVTNGIKPRIVELEDNVVEWINFFMDRELSGLIVRFDVTKWKREFLTTKGLGWGKNRNNNVMRHTYATMHVAAFRNPSNTALNMGHSHSSNVLEKHYKGNISHKEAIKYWEITPYEDEAYKKVKKDI